MNCHNCNIPMILVQTFESKHFKGLHHGMFYCKKCKEHYFKMALGRKMTSENIVKTGILNFNKTK